MEAISARILELLQTKEVTTNELKAVRSKLQKAAEDLPDKRFAELAGGLNDLIFRPKLNKYSEPHMEFVRRAVVGQTGQYEEFYPKDYQECLSFVKTFGNFKRKISIALEHVDTGRGDDGHGDLIDALPLCPLEELNTLFDEENFAAWEENQRENPRIKPLLHAEMYNEMRLKEALDVYIRHACKRCKLTPETPQEVDITIVHVKQSDEYLTELRLPDCVVTVPQSALLDVLINSPNKMIRGLKRKNQ